MIGSASATSLVWIQRDSTCSRQHSLAIPRVDARLTSAVLSSNFSFSCSTRNVLEGFDEPNEESVREERLTCTSDDCPKGLL